MEIPRKELVKGKHVLRRDGIRKYIESRKGTKGEKGQRNRGTKRAEKQKGAKVEFYPV